MDDDIVDEHISWNLLKEFPTHSAALHEIERLRAQVDIAHNIIGSEAMIWLIVGANHPQAHLDAMREAVNTYWRAYGNAFKGPDKDDARG